MKIARTPKLGLLGRFALASLATIILLGLVLGHLLKSQIRAGALANAREQAALAARLGVQPLLSRRDLVEGLSAERLAALDAAVRGGLGKDVARIKVWNRAHRVVYSDDRSIVGRAFPTSDELESALDGEIASEVSQAEKAENESERGHGALLEVYVPLSFGSAERPAGAFEIYLPYGPVAAAIAHGTRRLYLVLFGGLLFLYLALFSIVRRAREHEYHALHDGLTGLPNRRLLRDRVEQALRTARRESSGLAVMILDIDRFKEVNDTLGHGSGDVLLRQIGARLRAVLRDSDTIARLGGDEFAVLLPGVTAASAGASAERITRSLHEPFVVDELALEIEASIGIALYPEHGDEVETLMKQADAAMYVAKGAHCGHAIYSPQLDHHSPTRLTLIGELRRALRDHEFVLHYQPEVDLATGRVRSAEALVRWQHPHRGLLPPQAFVPLAEETALIQPLTLYVLGEALDRRRAWHEQGLELGVAVNVSARDLLDARFPDEVARLLATWSAPPSCLELEITESTVLEEMTRAESVLLRLKTIGVGLALDDFGRGSASLAKLRHLPVDRIKIDRSFVIGMERNEGDAVIVRSAIDLGRRLGLEVAAEGVETEEALRQLAALGCHVAQGFHLGRPMPEAEFEAWLREPGRLPGYPEASAQELAG